MDEPDAKATADAPVIAITPERSARSENSIVEALPEAAKTERIASMRRELADLQRHLIDAQQRVATELQGRAEDAERLEAAEALAQEREVASAKHSTRVSELETELGNVRVELAAAKATGEALRRDLAERDVTIEETSKHRAELDARTSSLNEAKTLLNEAKTLIETRDAELAKRTTEHETEREARSKLESQAEDHRKQHRELADQLERQFSALAEAKGQITTLHTELAAATSDRDAGKSDLETARTELAAIRTKLNDTASQLVRLGQELGDGSLPTEPKPKRTPPPMPSTPPPIPQTPRTATPVVETIVMTEEAKPASRVGTALFALGGAILGCVVTIVIMKSGGTSPVEDRAAPPAAPPPAPVAKPSPPSEDIHTPAPSEPPAPPPAPITSPSGAPPPVTVTNGTIVLPASASGHRLFVDGKVVEVKSSRASVPCGTHEVRVGSSGAPRKLDVACAGDTILLDEPHEAAPRDAN